MDRAPRRVARVVTFVQELPRLCIGQHDGALARDNNATGVWTDAHGTHITDGRNTQHIRRLDLRVGWDVSQSARGCTIYLRGVASERRRTAFGLLDRVSACAGLSH